MYEGVVGFREDVLFCSKAAYSDRLKIEIEGNVRSPLVFGSNWRGQ